MKETKKQQIDPVIEYYPETKRPLVRPKVRFGNAIFCFLTVLAADIAVSIGAIHLLRQLKWNIGIGAGGQFAILFSVLCLLSLLIFAKRIVIFFIRVYQRYVSYDVRSRCCMIPNCSEYMVLAIQKYGLIRGIKKGYARLHRCGFSETLEDYP